MAIQKSHIRIQITSATVSKMIRSEIPVRSSRRIGCEKKESSKVRLVTVFQRLLNELKTYKKVLTRAKLILSSLTDFGNFTSKFADS